ncbi:MAG: hypothetical protein OXH51_03215 [Gemmatimonadetes bacterium]|nr:hypothetical protein [Gemmatimonadota bacterium]
MTHLRKTTSLFAALATVALAASCGGDGGTTTVPPVDPPAPQNRAPLPVGSIGAITIAVGASVTTNVASNFNDPDGDALTYAAATSDASVATATVSGSQVTTTGEAAGSATITITARDPGGLTATQTMAVTVEAVNGPPTVTGTVEDQTLNVGDTLSTDVAGLFTDPDGDALTFAATSSDAAVATASVSESTLTVMALAVGSTTVTVSATDTGDLSAEFAFTVTVEQPNRAPEIAGSIDAQTLNVGDTVRLVVSMYFTDPDGDELSYEAVSSVTDVVEALAMGDTVQLAAMMAGSATVAVTASDPEGLTVTQEVSVTVQPPANRAPEAPDSIPAHDVIVDSAVVLDVSAYFSDPDGDELTYSAATSDAAIATASVDGAMVTTTGVSAGEEGVQMVTLMVTASDPEGLSVAQEVDVVVAAEDYAVWEGLSINEMGVVTALGGTIQLSGCFSLQLVNVFASNLGIQTIHWTEWQIRKGTGWVRVPGTRKEPTTPDEDAICGYQDLADREDGTPGPAPAGTYRVVGEVTIAEEGMDPVRIRRKTENDFTHDPGS